jgi:hypothetical protein
VEEADWRSADTARLLNCFGHVFVIGFLGPAADFAGIYEPVDVIDFDRRQLDVDRTHFVYRALIELSERHRR